MAHDTCSIDDCSAPAICKGMCGKHYAQQRRQQQPKRPKPTFIERFHSYRPEGPPGECWPWLGTVNHEGYGVLQDNRRQSKAHRVAYELTKGSIPDGYVIDHVCHNADPSCPLGDDCLHRRCCNPAHLEAVPSATNITRAKPLRRHKTHCPQGHPYDDPEHATLCQNGYPRCKTCHREREAARRAQRVA